MRTWGAPGVEMTGIHHPKPGVEPIQMLIDGLLVPSKEVTADLVELSPQIHLLFLKHSFATHNGLVRRAVVDGFGLEPGFPRPQHRQLAFDRDEVVLLVTRALQLLHAQIRGFDGFVVGGDCALDALKVGESCGECRPRNNPLDGAILLLLCQNHALLSDRCVSSLHIREYHRWQANINELPPELDQCLIAGNRGLNRLERSFADGGKDVLPHIGHVLFELAI